MAAAQQAALVAETIRGMKLAMKRRTSDSGDKPRQRLETRLDHTGGLEAYRKVCGHNSRHTSNKQHRTHECIAYEIVESQA